MALSADSVFQQVSYVNAICTIKGGTHVECVANQVIAKLLPVLKRKNKSEVRLYCDHHSEPFLCNIIVVVCVLRCRSFGMFRSGWDIKE